MFFDVVDDDDDDDATGRDDARLGRDDMGKTNQTEDVCSVYFFPCIVDLVFTCI